MTRRKRILATMLLLNPLGWLGEPLAHAAEAEPGETVYQRHCAACHDGANPEAPLLSSLQRMNAAFLEGALTEGKMASQGAALDKLERAQLVAWLTRAQIDHSGWERELACTGEREGITLETPYVHGWGFDANNHRHQGATSISADNVGTLEEAWVIAFPGVATMRSQPVVIGNTLFLAVADSHRAYAIDRVTGCLRWSYDAGSAPRSAMGFGRLGNNTPVVYFGDITGRIHMLEAESGRPIWRKKVGIHEKTTLTGPPTMVGDRLYVAHSSLETLSSIDANYPCCSISGAVSAHVASTGETLWMSRILPESRRRGESSAGTPLFGPAGASVWSAPLVDGKRGQIIVGTGPLAAPPDDGSGDAVIAFDLQTGSRRWTFQGTANDLWNGACRSGTGAASHPNCDFEHGKDFDFGAGIILATGDEGRDLILAGQKSGELYALDPQTGTPVWQTRLSEGSALGGIHWGMAVQGDSIYVPINDPDFPAMPGAPANLNDLVGSSDPRPGLYKVALQDGRIEWSWRVERACRPEASDRSPWPACPRQIGFSAAVLSLPGAVLSAGLDGTWRAHSTEDGHVLREENTLRAYENTLNGVDGHGGSIDNATMVAADRMLYVQSGYGFFGGIPGNVLIAYHLPPGEE
jgi:polyvinyl alcohol dehydrogenase (cytochrome)